MKYHIPQTNRIYFYFEGGCLYKFANGKFSRDKAFEKYGGKTENLSPYETAKVRGTHRIGGCVTEIKTATARIIIDMGDELSSAEYSFQNQLEITSAQTIIPIHSEKPEKLNDLGISGNIVILQDNQSFVVA